MNVVGAPGVFRASLAEWHWTYAPSYAL
jgi:hypothetical protein